MQDLLADPSELARAGRCFQLAWQLVRSTSSRAVLEELLCFCGCSVQLLPVPITQDSMISRCLLTSSSCTGAFTAEASLAVVEKTIRDSGFFSRPPSFRCICCFVARIRLSRFWQACCLVHVTLAFGVALVREQQNQGEGCPLSAADSGQPLVEHFRDRQPHASALHLF